MRSTHLPVHLVAAGTALAVAFLAAPAFGKSAAERAASVEDFLPDFSIRLVTAPVWDSRQSSVSESIGTVEMEGGIGILATVGTGDKQSWHGEAEAGVRETSPSDTPSLVGAIETWSLMANGYYGFKISDKVDGYGGLGLGLAVHSEDRFRDLALGYQLMLGIGYELTEKITARAGLRYFGTQMAALGRIRVEYGRPEVEVGIGYEF